LLVISALLWLPGSAGAEGGARRLVENGGRVAWYHGTGHDLIAFDAVVDPARQNTAVYVIRPDGSDRRCVTCDLRSIPAGFVGQPAWHPDGAQLLVQVENRNSAHRFYNHVSWGIDNDLWLVRLDGGGARQLRSTPAGHAALHPHFSPDGKRLMFAERLPTGQTIRDPALRRRAPGGESQWRGWRIHLADVDLSRPGDPLSNHRTLQPNGRGFYETHGFAPDGRILYSYTADGQGYVDDGYSAALDGSDVRSLTASPGTWDEHARYSPDGRRLAFMSSRTDATLRFPASRPADLRTELFLKDGDAAPHPVTDVNAGGRKRVVSDFDWDRDGRRIVFQVAELGGGRSPEVWVLDLPAAAAAA
jgi:Tol biopolymer transport system component